MIPKPLSELSEPVAAGIGCVFTDIDDTLTTDGMLTADAYASLERLDRAGIQVVPVTGRPAGWCDHIARMWPVAAVIGENGGLAMRYHRRQRRMETLWALPPQEIEANRLRLERLAEKILAEVPGAALASDQRYRIFDLAVDHCEDVTPLSAAEVDRIVEIFNAEGAKAKVSSIHVNGWFGTHDKLTMLLEASRAWSLPPPQDPRAVYLGDSPNDAPAFAAFRVSIGVANVARFLPTMSAAPKFITRCESGVGFTEAAAALLRARAAVAKGGSRGP